MFYNNYELNRWYEETKFFIASILGCIVAIIAFIIFIVMFFKSKDKAKKRKYGIISMVMILTALFCGFICIDEFIYTQIYLWIVVVILCLGGIISLIHINKIQNEEDKKFYKALGRCSLLLGIGFSISLLITSLMVTMFMKAFEGMK